MSSPSPATAAEKAAAFEWLRTLGLNNHVATRDCYVILTELQCAERFRASLQRIAHVGGRSTITPSGPVTGTGAWCAEQAKEALAHV